MKHYDHKFSECNASTAILLSHSNIITMQQNRHVILYIKTLQDIHFSKYATIFFAFRATGF